MSQVSKETSVDHVTQNMETNNRIAEHYYVTATPELRAWKEESMRRFAAFRRDPMLSSQAVVMAVTHGS